MKTIKTTAAWLESKIYFFAIIALLAWLGWLVWRVGVDLTANLSDIPYHLSVSAAFAKINAVTTWDFWESLPLGRAHNYPPLFHLIFANFMKTGLSTINIAKLMMEFTLVGGLAIYGWGISKLFNIKVAFLSMFLLASSFTFVRVSAMVLPSTITLFLAPALVYTMVKRKWLAYISLATLMLYLHLFMPLIILFGCFIYYLLCDRKLFWRWFWATVAAFVLYSPWLVHVLSGGFDYIKYFDSGSSISDWWISPMINIFVYLFAVVGILILMKKGRARTEPENFFLILFVVFLAVVTLSGNRIVNGHLLVIASLMAALAFTSLSRTKFISGAFLVLVALACSYQTLYLVFSYSHFRFSSQRSSFANFRHPDVRTAFKANDYKYISGLIHDSTKPGDSVVAMVPLYNDADANKYSQTSMANYWAVDSGLSILNARQPEIIHRSPADASKAKVLMTSTALADITADDLAAYDLKSDDKAVSDLKNVFQPLAYCVNGSKENVYFYLNKSSDTIKEAKPTLKLPLYIADSLALALVIIFLGGVNSRKNK